MLIVTRKLGETIVIGENIEISLVQIQLAQNQVRLGIAAPRSVGVYRKELLQAIRRENTHAAASLQGKDITDSLRRFSGKTSHPATQTPDASEER